MPSIKDNSTVQAIAREYCSNGRNIEKALLAVGYAPSYARNGAGHKLSANVRVKEAIFAIDNARAAKATHNWETAIRALQHAYAVADKQGNAQGMVAAQREMSAISGMHDKQGAPLVVQVGHATVADEDKVLRKRMGLIDRMRAQPDGVERN